MLESPRMLHARRVAEIALLLLASLLVLVAAAASLPSPLPAQQAAAAEPAYRPSFEGYISRVRTDPAVAGERIQLAGLGARLLVPLGGDRPVGGPRPPLLDRAADRVALGGFVTYAPDADRALTAWHYGVQTDVRLLAQPVAGRVEPLFSLGVGAFRTQHSSTVESLAPVTACRMRRADLALLVGNPTGECAAARVDDRALGTRFALSPALAARVWLLPDVAFRADAREVVVYDGGARHVFEVTTGLSFTR